MANPIKIGLIGLGRAGWGMHTEELRGKEDKFVYAAACDLIPERRQKMADRYGCAVYENMDELIADPNVELVVIATRSSDHYDHAMRALAAGKDVFLEKPMCRTHEEAMALLEAGSRPGGPRLFIRHNRRFESHFVRIRELLASGLLGEVYEIKLTRNSFQFRDDWQTIHEFGGGQLLNWGPHIVDQSLRLLESPVAQMFSDIKQTVAGGDSEDHIKIVFKGENGRIVDMEISGGAAQKSPEYLVYGTRGALIAEGAARRLRYIDPEQVLPPVISDPGTPGETFGSGTYRAADGSEIRWIETTESSADEDLSVIWNYLYASIREGAPYPITLEEAAGNMKVISEVKKGTRFE